MKVVTIPKGEQKCFCFSLEGSKKVYRLPLVAALPVSLFRKIIELSQADEEIGAAALSEVLFDVFDRYCPGLTDKVNLDQLQEISQMWQKASGIGVGE